MTCRDVVHNAFSYRFCPDPLPPPADRVQSLMHGRFIDELTGSPIAAPLTVSTSLLNIGARASASAVAGLVGNPARRFPGLAAATVSLDMTVSCRRFIRQSFTADIGPFNTGAGDPADYPHYFEPADLGDIGLHRQSTRISGRCVHDDGVSRIPLANATVELAGVWHRFPLASVDPLSVVEPPLLVSLLHGLQVPRIAGTDQVMQRSLLPQIGEEKLLLLPAAAGSNTLRLSDRVNLAAGQLLGIETGHGEKVEYLEIASIDGSSLDTLPATVNLVYPLQHFHRNGADAVRVNPQVPGSANLLQRDAIAGDTTLFLNALADIDNSIVEISGGAAAEYHRVRLYQVVSDAGGWFSLPPLSRVAMMQLHASHAGPLADVDSVFSPDYEQFGNRIDLIFG